jgi:hypothetical protein
MASMSEPDYPDRYWHCLVALPGLKKEVRQGIRNDLTFADLNREVIDPWREKRQFTVEGVVVTDQALVSDVRLVHTPQPMKFYADQLYAELAAAGVLSLADGRQAPFSRGSDHTNQLLFASGSVSAPAPSVALLLQLCERLPQAARFLASRREGKQPYKIAEEYDVQDLLHAVIRAYLKYSIDEEPLGKVGGARSSRADIAIPDLNTLIEIKYVRGPSDQQRIVEEFAQDLLLYTAWAPLQTFIYLVYNSADLRDPEAIARLQGDGNTLVNGKRYRTSIVLA